jgi:hypothetical protein
MAGKEITIEKIIIISPGFMNFPVLAGHFQDDSHMF